MGPGSTALTRTSGPYSTASCPHRESSAPLDAAYAGWPGMPLWAWTEEVSTTAPRCSRRSGRTARKPRKAPVRLTASWRSQEATDISCAAVTSTV